MRKNVNSKIVKGNRIYFKFKCNHCGECCLFLDVILTEEDIRNWMQKKRTYLIQYIQIQPQSLNSENILKAKIEKKFNSLETFILNNHLSKNKNVRGDFIKSSPEINLQNAFDKIFTPYSFEAILKGINLGLKYVLLSDESGYCIFFKGDQCAIHRIKPSICKQFPYDTNGVLAVNNWTLHICQGINRIH